jgi:hypothetical protein
MLTIRITDSSGKPLVGWRVEESNRTLESVPDNRTLENPEPKTTDSNGTIQDYFAANANISDYRLTRQEGEAAVFRQIESRSHALIEQTLRISSPDGGVIAIAVYLRRISNLENGNIHGNLIPAFISRGNHVNNFRVKLFPVSVTSPCIQR